MSNALTKHDSGRTAVANITKVDEAKDLRNKAHTLADYAKKAKDKELLEKAVDVLFEAERKAGEILIEMKRDGRRADKGNPKLQMSSDTTFGATTLKDLGISRDESARWQKVYGWSDEEYEEYKADAKDNGIASTTPYVKKWEKKHADKNAKSKPEKEDEMTGLLRTFIEAAMEAVEEAQSYEESGFRNSKPDAYRENMIEAIKAQRAIRDFFS